MRGLRASRLQTEQGEHPVKQKVWDELDRYQQQNRGVGGNSETGSRRKLLNSSGWERHNPMSRRISSSSSGSSGDSGGDGGESSSGKDRGWESQALVRYLHLQPCKDSRASWPQMFSKGSTPSTDAASLNGESSEPLGSHLNPSCPSQVFLAADMSLKGSLSKSWKLSWPFGTDRGICRHSLTRVLDALHPLSVPQVTSARSLDSGVLGIIDKLLCMKAELFLIAPAGCGGEHSYTKEIREWRDKHGKISIVWGS